MTMRHGPQGPAPPAPALPPLPEHSPQGLPVPPPPPHRIGASFAPFERETRSPVNGVQAGGVFPRAGRTDISALTELARPRHSLVVPRS